MEGVNGGAVEEERKPLSEVVGDCVQRWFQDALKEARRGDSAMQVLVAQMYHSGYGIPKNEQKDQNTPYITQPRVFRASSEELDPRGEIYYQGRAWAEKASRYRPSVWKVGTKRPGYNASDSDSDEMNDDEKQ